MENGSPRRIKRIRGGLGMATVSKNEHLQKATKWAVLGIAITVIGILVTVYFGLRRSEPSVSYTIIQESDVLDIKEPVEELAIHYKGRDIRKEGKNLRIVALKVVNDGEKDIIQGDFDQKLPWGLRVTNAEIVDGPKLIDASSAYIQQELKAKAVNGKTMEFSKIIFEKERSFTVEFSVLHSASDTPAYEVLGKIAGIPPTSVGRMLPEPKVSLWKQVLGGNWIVLAMRLVVYGLIFFAAFFILLGISLGIIEGFAGRARRRRNARIGAYVAPLARFGVNTERAEAIFNLCGGSHGTLGRLIELVRDAELLSLINLASRNMRGMEKKGQGKEMAMYFQPRVAFPRSLMLQDRETGEVSVTDGAVRDMECLLELLKREPPAAEILHDGSLLDLEIVDLLADYPRHIIYHGKDGTSATVTRGDPDSVA